MHRRTFIKAFTLSASVIAMGMSFGVQAAETIKVGIMHSLSGTMAISETPLKDVALMTIDEINAKGGVLGKKLEPVVVDPASNWPLFAEKARQLISQDKVAVVFGCWTSVSRKSVLPVFEVMAKTGNIPERDMFNTFNMGVGMCVAVDKNDVHKAVAAIEAAGEKAVVLGEIVSGDEGVILC